MCNVGKSGIIEFQKWIQIHCIWSTQDMRWMQISHLNQPEHSWERSLSNPMIIYSQHLLLFLFETISSFLTLEHNVLWLSLSLMGFFLVAFFFFQSFFVFPTFKCCSNLGLIVFSYHLVSVIHTMWSYSVSGLKASFIHWWFLTFYLQVWLSLNFCTCVFNSSLKSTTECLPVIRNLTSKKNSWFAFTNTFLPQGSTSQERAPSAPQVLIFNS